jgi:hypothetical protein
MRPLTAHCHASLAALFHRTGMSPAVHTHVTSATGTYREMGMMRWLEKVETEFGAR